jgi:hypothetical protein
MPHFGFYNYGEEEPSAKISALAREGQGTHTPRNNLAL